MTTNSHEQTEQANALHIAIMNLPCDPPYTEGTNKIAYRVGHRDARHAAAELVAAQQGEAKDAARILGLLREARATLGMWKDVAPAVSLCADIDAALADAK